MADITKPILLDETGQAIKNAILEVKTAIENQSGGGEEADSGTFELIEEITTTEELTSVSRTAWPDGTAYQLKAAKVKMEIAAGAGTGNVNTQYLNTESSTWLVLGLSSTSTIATSLRYHWSRAWRDYGKWECEFTGGASSKFATATYKMAGYDEVINDLDITRIQIQSTTSGVPIPAGTIIKIYGVRA